MKNFVFGYARVSTEQQNLDRHADGTREWLSAACARGRNGGRPPVDQESVRKAIKLYLTGQYSVKEITELTGVKPSTLYKNLRSS